MGWDVVRQRLARVSPNDSHRAGADQATVLETRRFFGLGFGLIRPGQTT
jgi:hypothetical protein